MTPQLESFLGYYLPKEKIKKINKCFNEVGIKRQRHLIKPGQDCSFLAFIQQGCFRVYHYDLNDREIITWFSFQEMVVTDMLGFYTSGIAKFYVQALEDSIVYTIRKRDLENLCREDPEYLEFGRKLAEGVLTRLMQRTMSLHTMSAEERYKELLKQPEFMQKIPLKYLASFLGITDTSLSRIRRNLS